MESYRIHYIEDRHIDKKKWDACIASAGNGLIYAYSFYLDAMAGNWDGLVLGDYKAVMPLTWNKKYGIFYLYQPFICAQLGVFGETIDENQMLAFFSAVPQRFRYWDIYLNHQNLFSPENFKTYQRSNYVLDLQKPYETLVNDYRESTRRNIDKAVRAGCVVKKDFDAARVTSLAMDQMKSFARVSNKEFEKVIRLFHFLQQRQQAITYGVFSAGGQMLASCLFFFSHQRAYYILVGNHPDGRTLGASHLLIDGFIKDYAGQKMILDFEGSDLRNLAFFYSSFGASEEKYAAIKLNRLPWYAAWLKK